jgi:hypothetical protein
MLLLGFWLYICLFFLFSHHHSSLIIIIISEGAGIDASYFQKFRRGTGTTTMLLLLLLIAFLSDGNSVALGMKRRWKRSKTPIRGERFD